MDIFRDCFLSLLSWLHCTYCTCAFVALFFPRSEGRSVKLATLTSEQSRRGGRVLVDGRQNLHHDLHVASGEGAGRVVGDDGGEVLGLPVRRLGLEADRGSGAALLVHGKLPPLGLHFDQLRDEAVFHFFLELQDTRKN